MKRTIEIEVPEGYEFITTTKNHNYSSLQEVETTELGIFKRIEIKNFELYTKKYLNKILDDSDRMILFIADGFANIETYFNQNEYNKIQFEFKMGLLKYICDDKSINMLHLMGDLRHNSKTISTILQCPEEFIKSILEA